MSIQPIVRTRPITSYIDFCWFVQPRMLVGHSDVLNAMKTRIDDVLNTDILSGGAMRVDRWHVLRIGQFTLIGLATTGFDFKDEAGRSVRGYYGVVSDEPFNGVPSEDELRKLHDRFVAPYLHATTIDIKDGDDVEIAIQAYDDDLVASEYFNFNEQRTKLFGLNNYPCLKLFSSAVKASRDVESFEFVYGLNTNYYAKRKRFMNVVSLEQTIDVIEEFPQADTPRAYSQSNDFGAETPQDTSEHRMKNADSSRAKQIKKGLHVEPVDGRNSWFLKTLCLVCSCYEWVRGDKATCRMRREYGNEPSPASVPKTEWRTPRARY